MTRIDKWPLWARRAAIICAFFLCGLSAMTPQKTLKHTGTVEEVGHRDPELYRSVIARVSNGENYYAAVAIEQRRKDFPLRPFVTVRLPTLAVFSALLGEGGSVAALGLLALLTIVAWTIRLSGAFGRLWLLPLVPLVFSVMMISGPVLILFHESWAALLITFSLALWRPAKWRAALIVGVVAALFRETAIAYLLLMLAGAAFDRRWREASEWAGGLLIVALSLWIHAAAVAGVTIASDITSPGWSGLGGWPLFLSAMQASSPLAIAPDWTAKLLIPLAFIGWASWLDPLGLRVTGLLSGFGLMIMLFARPDNWYWALLLCPLLLSGLGFLPNLFKAWRNDPFAVKPAG